MSFAKRLAFHRLTIFFPTQALSGGHSFSGRGTHGAPFALGLAGGRAARGRLLTTTVEFGLEFGYPTIQIVELVL